MSSARPLRLRLESCAGRLVCARSSDAAPSSDADVLVGDLPPHLRAPGSPDPVVLWLAEALPLWADHPGEAPPAVAARLRATAAALGRDALPYAFVEIAARAQWMLTDVAADPCATDADLDCAGRPLRAAVRAGARAATEARLDAHHARDPWAAPAVAHAAREAYRARGPVAAALAGVGDTASNESLRVAVLRVVPPISFVDAALVDGPHASARLRALCAVASSSCALHAARAAGADCSASEAALSRDLSSTDAVRLGADSDAFDRVRLLVAHGAGAPALTRLGERFDHLADRLELLGGLPPRRPLAAPPLPPRAGDAFLRVHEAYHLGSALERASCAPALRTLARRGRLRLAPSGCVQIFSGDGLWRPPCWVHLETRASLALAHPAVGAAPPLTHNPHRLSSLYVPFGHSLTTASSVLRAALSPCPDVFPTARLAIARDWWLGARGLAGALALERAQRIARAARPFVPAVCALAPRAGLRAVVRAARDAAPDGALAAERLRVCADVASAVLATRAQARALAPAPLARS